MRERTCCRSGKRRSILESLRVVLGRGRYFYQVSRVSSGTYHVYRRPAAQVGELGLEHFEWLCANRHWAKHENGQPDVLYYEFHSSRAADEHVRGLNSGVPTRHGLWLALGGVLAALVGAAASEVIEAVKLAL